MVKNNKHTEKDGFGEVEQVLTKTEQFIENHLKTTLYVVGGIVFIILAYLGITKFYASPRSKDAQVQVFQAQNYFSKDSFNLALNGDGNSLGFLDIIDDYGSTETGKLAKYYAGICYLHLGEYDNAISYLKKFKTDDMLLAPLTKSAIGDAYVEKGNYEKAISFYKEGLEINTNEFTTPAISLKLALAYEAKGDVEKAISTLKEVKSKYPTNGDIATIEKTLARISQ